MMEGVGEGAFACGTGGAGAGSVLEVRCGWEVSSYRGRERGRCTSPELRPMFSCCSPEQSCVGNYFLGFLSALARSSRILSRDFSRSCLTWAALGWY